MKRNSCPGHDDMFVHPPLLAPPLTGPEQAQNMHREQPAPAHRATKKGHVARNKNAIYRIWQIWKIGADFVTHTGADDFVGIQPQNPVRLGSDLIQRPVELRGIVAPWLLQHLGPKGAGQRTGIIL